MVKGVWNMIYVIADIHGCYDVYISLLKKIKFSDEDELFVLGDVVDRGPEPIKVLQDMMMRPNVYPILGNHDYMALKVLKKLCVEDILDYLQEFTLYEDVCVGNKRFILAHADLHGYEEKCMEGCGSIGEVDLDEFDFSDFIFYRADYEKRYFKDKNTFLVTGHTPTFSVREDGEALILEKNGHIAIDCGCVYGKRLAAYCLNDGNVEYVG